GQGGARDLAHEALDRRGQEAALVTARAAEQAHEGVQVGVEALGPRRPHPRGGQLTLEPPALAGEGGLQAMERINRAKAAVLYDFLDQTEYYYSPVAREDRSLMNVPFRLKNEALDAEFLKQAQACGLRELKGHRSVGGMRASIYNAMPAAGVKALVDFMREFQSRHGG
ncbi:MAG: aminotransferase class V-fold PLP-dependent enzyme, partial [Pseudomonadota bacterium]